MHLDIWQLVELVLVFLGGTVALARFWPQLKTLGFILQVAFVTIQLFNAYMKNHPEKRKQIEVFLSQMMEHYFKTHPEGQRIASQTEIDEKVHAFLDKHTQEKEVKHDSFLTMLGIKVDNK